MSDEDVGYGRPPRHTQWKKGQSGNPNGRPKGAKGLKQDLAEELAEMLTLAEGGTPVTVSKQQALLKSLLARGIKGDTRAGMAILSMVTKLFDPVDDEAESAIVSESDSAIIARFLERAMSEAANPKSASKGEPDAI